MTRHRSLPVLFLTVGIAIWAIARPGKTAHPGTDAVTPTSSRETVAADFAENGEEAAAHRWASNQTRHWRHLMVQR